MNGVYTGELMVMPPGDALVVVVAREEVTAVDRRSSDKCVDEHARAADNPEKPCNYHYRYHYRSDHML